MFALTDPCGYNYSLLQRRRSSPGPYMTRVGERDEALYDFL